MNENLNLIEILKDCPKGTTNEPLLKNIRIIKKLI